MLHFNELIALGGAFLVAGLLARGGRRLGLPTIPFFMLAGLLSGPFTPGIVLFEEPGHLELFAAVGLILLLFHIGLEFSLGDLQAGGRGLLISGAAYIVLNVGAGFAVGFGLGWGTQEAFVIAGALGISSSAIVTKLLIEFRRLANDETPLILGIIVVEDVFLALYLAMLAPVLGDADSVWDALLLFGQALAFLAVLLLVARKGSRWVGALISAEDDELLTVLFVGLAVLVAGLAESLGVSDAIGALLVGMVVAETAVAARVERLVRPLRDAFAAVFFYTFGLTIDPADVAAVAGPVAVAVAATVVANVAAGIVAARRNALDRRAAITIGLTLLGRGEFSLILVGLAIGAGLDERLAPFVATYVLVLAFLGPLLASRPERFERIVPRWALKRS